jgi:hypothetical protein
MLNDLKTARKTLKPFITAAGYKFASCSKDWLGENVATAELRSYGKDGRFVITCGVDYRLPQEKRNEIWNTYGRRLTSALIEAGFPVDLKTFGGYHTFIVG